MSMNIHAKPGTKVIFQHPNAGSCYDQKAAEKHLTKGQTYTIVRTQVEAFRTNVHLEEMQGTFNSVHFEEV